MCFPRIPSSVVVSSKAAAVQHARGEFLRNPLKDTGFGAGAYVNWQWVEEQFASVSRNGVDVMLLARDRTVLYGPADLEGQTLQVATAIVGSQSQSGVEIDRWPDGKEYLSAVMPALQFRNLPRFGWSVLVRQETTAALGPTRDLTTTYWAILISASLVSLSLLVLFANWLSTPLERLTEFGHRLASGTAATAPYEKTRYKEAEELGHAFVRLQSKLADRTAPKDKDTIKMIAAMERLRAVV